MREFARDLAAAAAEARHAADYLEMAADRRIDEVPYDAIEGLVNALELTLKHCAHEFAGGERLQEAIKAADITAAPGSARDR